MMKKPLIALGALLVAAGASVGAFLAVKNKSDQETRRQQEQLADNVLFSLDADSITHIEIDTGDSFYAADLQDGAWVLTEDSSGDSYLLNQNTFIGISTYISDLTAETSYGEITDDKKAMYGLGSPYRLTVNDGSDHTLCIGSESPTKDYYYAMADGKDNIYAISASDALVLLNDITTVKTNDLIPYGDTDIQRMTLKKNGQTVYDLTLDTDTNMWTLPEDYEKLQVQQTSVTSMINVLTRLEAQQMLENHLEDLSAYGFDHPTAEFTVYGKDGTSETVLFSPYVSNPDYISALITDSNQVELYYAGDAEFTERTIIDFVLSTIEAANLYAISGFEFSCAESADSFTVDMTGGTGECRGTEIDLGNAVFSSLLESFYNSFSYIAASDIDPKADPELNDPIFSAVYHYTDRPDTTLDLVERSESDAYVFVDGKYTGMVTETAFLSGTASVTASYNSLCTQIDVEPNLK